MEISAQAENPSLDIEIELGRKRAENSTKSPCYRNGMSARAEKATSSMRSEVVFCEGEKISVEWRR